MKTERYLDKLCTGIEATEAKYQLSAPYFGKLKREIVIEAIFQWLPVPGWLPKYVKRWAAGLLVDLAIYIYNRLFGHKWLKPVTEGVKNA